MSVIDKMCKKGQVFFDLWKDIKCAKCGECLNNELDHLCYDTDDKTGEIINIKCYHHMKCRPQKDKYLLWNHIQNIGWDMIYVAWHNQEDTEDEPFVCNIKLFWKRVKK